MAKYHEYSEAFEIFATYPVYQEVAAEHDVIYAGPPPESVSEEHKARLEELGWFVGDFDSFQKFV